jgi:hypothetical protein
MMKQNNNTPSNNVGRRKIIFVFIIPNPHQLGFVTRVSVGYLPYLPLQRKPLRLSPLPLQRFPKPDIWQAIQVYLTKSSDPTITGGAPVSRVPIQMLSHPRLHWNTSDSANLSSPSTVGTPLFHF